MQLDTWLATPSTMQEHEPQNKHFHCLLDEKGHLKMQKSNCPANLDRKPLSGPPLPCLPPLLAQCWYSFIHSAFIMPLLCGRHSARCCILSLIASGTLLLWGRQLCTSRTLNTDSVEGSGWASWVQTVSYYQDSGSIFRCFRWTTNPYMHGANRAGPTRADHVRYPL